MEYEKLDEAVAQMEVTSTNYMKNLTWKSSPFIA